MSSPSLSNKYENMLANIGGDKLLDSGIVELPGITIDKQLQFDQHICNVCMKAQRKLIVLMGIGKYLDFNMLRILFNHCLSLNLNFVH